MLTNRYLGGIPADSRAGQEAASSGPAQITADELAKVRQT